MKRLLTSLLATATLAGCMQSQIPVARSFDYSEQERMQAIQHWDVLAERQALAISALSSRFTGPLYVAPAPIKSPFAEVFNQLLISRLIEHGVPVTQSKSSSTILTTHFQLVKHKAQRDSRAAAGSATGLALGGMAVAGAVNQWSEPMLVAVPLLIAGDLTGGRAVSPTASELAVTTRVTDFNNILFSKSATYYVNGADARHYEPDEAAEALQLTTQP